MKYIDNWKAYLSGLCMSIIFGLTFLFTKKALITTSPMVLLAYRFCSATIVLTVLLIFKVIKVNYKNKPLKGIITLSIFYPVISFIFETQGIKYVSISHAGIMMSLMPIFVMILGIIILKEIPSKTQKLFIGISIIGVMFTMVFAKNSGESNYFLGSISLLICVISCSANNVLSRKYSVFFTPVEITYAMLIISSIVFTSMAIIQGLINKDLYEKMVAPLMDADALISILYLGIFASVIAFFAMNYMLAHLQAVNVSVFNNLATLVSILSGIIVVNESLYWYQIIGGILIVASVIGINYLDIIKNKEVINKKAKAIINGPFL